MENSEPRSETCPKHGEYLSRFEKSPYPALFPDKWTKCATCAEESRNAEADRERAWKERQEAREREESIQSMISGSGIPARYRDSKWSDLDRSLPEVAAAIDKIRAYADEWDFRRSRCMLLNGGVGGGKTALACLVMRQVMHRHLARALYVTAREYFMLIRDTYRKESETTELEVTAKYSDVPLLVIDEIGMQKGSDAEAEAMQHLIDQRYQSMLSTILISNLPLSEWPKFIGDRALDRLRENGGEAIAFTWPSFRK